MAKKKKRKIGWLKTLLFCILTPFIIWFLAFVIWFYWNDITGLFGRRDNTLPGKSGKEIEQSTKPSGKTVGERIGDEDRKNLEEILKSKK